MKLSDIQRAYMSLGILVVIAIFIMVVWVPEGYPEKRSEEGEIILSVLKEEFPESTVHDDRVNPDIIAVVHNGVATSCRSMMRLLQSIDEKSDEYTLAVYVLDEQNYLTPLKTFDSSCWKDVENSRSWVIHPVIFFEGEMFVGYGRVTRQALQKSFQEQRNN